MKTKAFRRSLQVRDGSRPYAAALLGLGLLGLPVVSACDSPFDTEAVEQDAGVEQSHDDEELPRFSFFYTSLDAMRRLSGSDNGFGGDLRFGQESGLEGADEICKTIAQEQDEIFGQKTWRAFLSVTEGPSGGVINAIDRIGDGPWYDRKGRLIANDQGGLIRDRPDGDLDVVNDLPDETGEATSGLGSTADVITGSNPLGLLDQNAVGNADHTCNDWTDDTLQRVFVAAGHAWLSGGLENWISAHAERSCVPGVNLMSTGVSDGSSIGSGGGWGGIYCFATTP